MKSPSLPLPLPLALALGCVAAVLPTAASAHVSVSSGPGFANTTQEVTFAVGHGCAGADTYAVRIDLPAGVTSVRTLRSDFGPATVEKDDTGAVRAVVWQKPEADLLPSDSAFYKLTLRLKLPDAPFTTLHFPTRQTCKSATGEVTTVDWSSTEQSESEDAEPAPALHVLPARQRGWNRYTVPTAQTDLKVFFGDALIVWRGEAGYSANPLTTEQIAATPGASELTELAAGDEVWVKY